MAGDNGLDKDLWVKRTLMSVSLILSFSFFALTHLIIRSEAKGASEHSEKDRAVLFLDEVTNSVVFGADLNEKHGEKSPSDGIKQSVFADLDGKILPGSLEYQALTHALTKEEFTALESDANVEVPSLAGLREKYNSAFQRLSQVSSLAPAEFKFQDLLDSGWTSSQVEGIRVIPLKDSVMIVAESGEKRILRFPSQGEGASSEKSGDGKSAQYEVAVLAVSKVFPENQKLKSSMFLALRQKTKDGNAANVSEKSLWVVRLAANNFGRYRIASSENTSSASLAELLNVQEFKRLLVPTELDVELSNRQPAQDEASE